MTKLLALIGVVLWVTCVSAASAEYQPTFQTLCPGPWSAARPDVQ